MGMNTGILVNIWIFILNQLARVRSGRGKLKVHVTFDRQLADLWDLHVGLGGDDIAALGGRSTGDRRYIFVLATNDGPRTRHLCNLEYISNGKKHTVQRSWQPTRCLADGERAVTFIPQDELAQSEITAFIVSDTIGRSKKVKVKYRKRSQLQGPVFA